MPNIQLANNLRFLRTAHKLTQDYLSEVLNISRQAYSNYENSKRTPDLDSLMRISRIYKVSLDQLVYHDLSQKFLDASQISEEKVPYNLALNTETGNTIYLTEEEMDYIVKFRSLSHENKQILSGFLSSNAQNCL